MDEAQEQTQNFIPRWTEDFDISTFDVQAVLREAQAQKKSAYKVLKSLGYPVKKFLSHQVPQFKAATKDGDTLIPATASSTAIDLSGDDFAASAIEEMQAQALGTTIFLNHSYILPEDVYGKISDCSIDYRQEHNPVTRQTEDLTCWDLQIAPVGEDENPRAVRVTNMLQKSKLKLGVSVTVLVLKSVARKGGGRTITSVFYIESSMVGIPCNQTAWADGSAGKAAKAAAGPLDQYQTFSPVDLNDPASVERLRAELAAWLEQDGAPKGASMATENAQATEPTATTTTESVPAPAARKQIAQGLFKGLYEDEIDEYVNSVSFLVNRLVEALYDWKLKEADEAALEELLAEFTTHIKGAMQRDPDAEPWMVYYSLSRLMTEQLSKAGARNSAADQELLNKMHDMLVDCGVGCSKLEDLGAADAAEKSASSRALTEATSKAAELQAQVATLTAEKTDLETKLATAQAELDRWEASGPVVLEALRQHARTPLPRAGQASVSRA